MIYIASDHGGYKLKKAIKEFLIEKNLEFTDLGTNSEESVDYPDYAKAVANKVSETGERGILICGTGIGMSMAANKIKGIRAALVYDEFTAKMSRAHNDSNVLCLGERTTDKDLALKLVDIWLSTEFEGGRHERRVKKIED